MNPISMGRVYTSFMISERIREVKIFTYNQEFGVISKIKHRFLSDLYNTRQIRFIERRAARWIRGFLEYIDHLNLRRYDRTKT